MQFKSAEKARLQKGYNITTTLKKKEFEHKRKITAKNTETQLKNVHLFTNIH